MKLRVFVLVRLKFCFPLMLIGDGAIHECLRLVLRFCIHLAVRGNIIGAVHDNYANVF